MTRTTSHSSSALIPEAQRDFWEIGYRWSYGDRGRAWLKAASDGRLVGYRVPGSGRVFIPPTAPVEAAGCQSEEIDLGPGGTVRMVTSVAAGLDGMSPKVVGQIRLDGAPVDLFAVIELGEPWSRRLSRRVVPGTRVRFIPPSVPLKSISDIRFGLACDV